jgi:hypothetical protein
MGNILQQHNHRLLPILLVVFDTPSSAWLSFVGVFVVATHPLRFQVEPF